MINTIIFDLDGTLLDTLEDLTSSVNFVLEKNGYPLRTRDEIRSFVGDGIRKLIQRAAPNDVGELKSNNLLEEFVEYYIVHCNDTTKPYDGIIEMLRELRDEGYRLAIVSNKADFGVKALSRIYFDGLVDVAIGEREKEGIRKKPAPDLVELALKELGATSEESIYVGDSRVDYETACNSKMRSILCAWGFCGREKLKLLNSEGALDIVDTPADIIELIRRDK